MLTSDYVISLNVLPIFILLYYNHDSGLAVGDRGFAWVLAIVIMPFTPSSMLSLIEALGPTPI